MKKFLWVLLSLVCVLSFSACTDKNTADKTSATIAPAPGEQYVYSVDDAPFSAYESGKVIAEEKVGEKLREVTVTAGWRRAGEQLSEETLKAEVYALREVSEDVAAALKFIDKGEALTTDHYYVILNPEADLTAVQAYVIAPYTPNTPGDE